MTYDTIKRCSLDENNDRIHLKIKNMCRKQESGLSEKSKQKSKRQ